MELLRAECDVVIVGGGPAGTAAAIALARAGRTVTLLERSEYATARVGEVLPPDVRSPLLRLGMWDRFLECQPVPSPGTVSVWGGETSTRSFIFSPHGKGWHVERRAFDAALARGAREAGAVVCEDARPTAYHRQRDGWRVEATVGSSTAVIRPRLMIDATGRASWLAVRLGRRRWMVDTLVAVLGYLPAAPGADDPRLMIETVKSGWWYSAPLPTGAVVTAFLTDADLLPAGATTGSSLWLARLREAPQTLRRVGSLAAVPPLRVVRADTSRLDECVGAGWLATGDAAASFDPLWGRGVCHALESGLSAAATAQAVLGNDTVALDEYAARLDAQFEVFLRERAANYRLESRWRSETFWQRRGPPSDKRGRSAEFSPFAALDASTRIRGGPD